MAIAAACEALVLQWWLPHLVLQARPPLEEVRVRLAPPQLLAWSWLAPGGAAGVRGGCHASAPGAVTCRIAVEGIAAILGMSGSAWRRGALVRSRLRSVSGWPPLHQHVDRFQAVAMQSAPRVGHDSMEALRAIIIELCLKQLCPCTGCNQRILSEVCGA